MKVLLVLLVNIFSIACIGQTTSEYSPISSKKLLGVWSRLSENVRNTCFCDNSVSFTFKADGSFSHNEYKSHEEGTYRLKKDYIVLSYKNGLLDSIKSALYRDSYLVLATSNSEEAVFIKDKYIGPLAIFPALPIFRGKFFLEGNFLEAKVNGKLIVFDSVYAYGDKRIFVNAFSRENGISLALKFGGSDNVNISNPRVSLIGSGSINGVVNGIPPASDAAVRVSSKEFNTSMGVFTGFPCCFGKGKGRFENIVYLSHPLAFSELSADFSFEASTRSDEKEKDYEMVKVTEGRFKILRIITQYSLEESLK